MLPVGISVSRRASDRLTIFSKNPLGKLNGALVKLFLFSCTYKKTCLATRFSSPLAHLWERVRERG
jgi:hypothetical protein